MAENKNAKTPEDDDQPMAWFSTSPDRKVSNKFACKPTEVNWVEPRYTAPPKRELTCVCGAVWEGETMVHPPRKAAEWVGLTDNDIEECTIAAERDYERYMRATRGQQLDQRDQLDWWIARAIEARLKEKNHG